VVIDRPRAQEAAPAPTSTPRPTAMRVQVDPVLGPSVGGMNLRLTF
jgi:hypothetical protein